MNRTDRSKVKLIAVTLFSGLIMFAFSTWIFEARTTAQPVESEPAESQPVEPQAQPQKSAFSHTQHLNAGADLKCTDCHKPTSEGAVTLARPYHDACTNCHQEWFDAKPVRQAFCTSCHTEVKENEAPGLRQFPDYNKDSAILFDFSHKQHLNVKGKVAQVVGGRVDCKQCHSFDAKGEKATYPAHTECAKCHDIQGIAPRLASDSTNTDCLGCHQQKEQNNPNYKKVRRFIVDPAHAQVSRSGQVWRISDTSSAQGYGNTMMGRDLKFSHDKHLTDTRNQGITCDTCHLRIDEKESISELSIPSMWDCTMCHESRRVRSDYRIDNCAVCHTQITSGRKPRNHTLTERPYDHTVAFRTRHAEAARAPEAKCAFCHEMLSSPKNRIEGFVRTEEKWQTGNNNCDECHKAMRPRSHTPRWRNDLHGRMASMNRMNCAVCHESDMCIRCHNTRPRSHNPLNAFVNGGHRFQAQINVRSCFTCHDFAQTCERCHSRPLR